MAESPAGIPLVQVSGLEVTYRTRAGLFRSGEVHALNGVDLTIARGETVALVGESGSGKSTLGKATIRLVEPTAGCIRFDGADITHVPSDQLRPWRKRAQIVFQDPFSSLNPYLTVGDLVAEPLVIDGELDEAARRAKVDEVLAAVELLPVERFVTAYPTQLSGGQRQRVGIARALVRDPDYIVLDEPVSMIDASSRVEMLDLLARLQQDRGVAYLYITHDIASARHFAERIAVMYGGAIVELGNASEVIDHPWHPYTKSLVAAIPEPDPANRFRRRDAIPGEPLPGGALPAGCLFATRCPLMVPGTCDVTRPSLDPRSGIHAVACHLVPECPP